ncbi:hypothetical protein CPLU01_07786 [Colletotrichum plurivorum]|uniref:Hypervirulence associated protein TUDOR domain-containing protein n=1 Tax=Colletotrichum plurivorum TaxID=2175906 RepID=A0A8H6KDP9_9PEZI|nr:hypothetical protein CPLU01_07786 [Colletotrichum plurivorum]
MKGKEEVIAEFNEYVNMTAEELESWLKSGDSNSAGWPKDDAEGDGETVGHDSGRKIVEILKENPEKKEDAYTDEQVEHMRKVVAYCKRHLAQESKSNSDKSEEEVKKTKSYASLKNWGHDFLKAQGKESESKGDEKEKKESNGSKKQKNGSTKKEEGEKADDAEEEKGDEEEDQSEEKAGDKRKKADEETGANKKRQTRQGEGKKADENGKDAEEEEAKEDSDEEMEDDGEEDKENGSGKSKKGPKKGDTVSWKWGNGNPEGKVLDVKEEKTTIETKNGNEVSRDGSKDDPAVVLDTGKSKAIKANHELD